MNKTRIEYGDYHLPFFTGCDQPKEVCATKDKCWARAMAHRFHRDFRPRGHPDLLYRPIRLRKPARILVSFGGDMFGDWTFGTDEGICFVEAVVNFCTKYPQHTFLFLTKSPWNLPRLTWPDNAWVGASVVSDGPMTTALTNLANVKAQVRWLSVEPLLGAITMRSHPMKGIVDWLVIGAQTGPGAVKPWRFWIGELIEASNKAGIPIWMKNNLAPILGSKLRQEVPDVH